MSKVRDGTQLYCDNDIDVPYGKETMETFKKEIWPEIKHFFKEGSSVLDLGSGNGRCAAFFSDYVNTIHAVDAYRDANPIYHRDNILFSREDIKTYQPNTKFDVVFLYGTLYLIPEYFDKLYEFLAEEGSLVIVESTFAEGDIYSMEDLLLKIDPNHRTYTFIQPNRKHRVTIVTKYKTEGNQQ